MAAITISNLLLHLSLERDDPGYKYDGDYGPALPCGLPVPSYPFLDQGDTETVIYSEPHEQTLAEYAQLDLMLPHPEVDNAYPFGDVNFRDLGAGIVRFDRQFGNIPKQRIVRGQSFRYNFQYVAIGTNTHVGSRPRNVDSMLIYDYFLSGQESDFPLLEAPGYELIETVVFPVGDAITGSEFPLTIDGRFVVGVDGVDAILAEADTYAEYRGAVRCRVRRTIVPPTAAFWHDALT